MSGLVHETRLGPSRAWRGVFMVFLFGALCYTVCTTKAPSQALAGPEKEPSWHLPFLEASSPGFMVFLFGALCCTICTMKAPPQALEGPGEEPSWHLPFNGIYGSLLSRPWKGLERRLHGVHARCSVLYNMHHEGSSPGPGEEPSWYLFLLSVMFDKAKSPASQGAGNSHATYGSGLALINWEMPQRTLCCAVCTMKGSGLGRCCMQHTGDV